MPETSSPAAAAPPADQVVRVEFDRDLLRLALAPTKVHVRPGDRIIWLFHGIPDGFFPWIRFLPGEESVPGPRPVESVMQNAGGLWGTIAADAEIYGYRASIQTRYSAEREDEPGSFFSSPAELVVHGTGQDPADLHVVRVRGDAGRLVVDPGLVRLREGGQVEWHFDADILKDTQGPLTPRVQFTSYGSKVEGDPQSIRDLSLGPFTTFAYESDPEDGGATVKATGYAAHPAGSYSYRVLSFRESDGQVVWASSPDPTIDDEGPPP